MTQRPVRSGAARFAHLLGGFRSAAKAEDEPEKKPEDETKPGGKKAKAEEPEPEEVIEGDPDEGVDGDPKPELEDVEDPDDTVEEEDAPEERDSDPKMRKAAKSGRKAERSRWAAVMGHEAAAGRIPTACHLLTSTTMSAKAVVETLKGVPAAEAPRASGNLGQRMAGRKAPDLGAAPPPAPAAGTTEAFVAAVKASMAKVRG